MLARNKEEALGAGGMNYTQVVRVQLGKFCEAFSSGAFFRWTVIYRLCNARREIIK